MPDANSMNVDDEDGPRQLSDVDIVETTEDGDVEMDPDVTHYIDENGWFIAAPRDDTSTGGAIHNQTADTSIAVLRSNMPESTNAGPTGSTHSEDSPTASAIPTEGTSGSRTDETRLPRTSRFTENQIMTDNMMIQDLVNSLQDDIHSAGEGGVIANAADAYSINMSAISDSLDVAHQTIQSGDALSVHDPPGNSTHTSSAWTAGRFLQPVESHINQSTRYAGSPGHPPILGSNEVSGEHGGRHIETSNISHRDFMRFVHSVENLSASVRTLIIQGGGSPSGSPSARPTSNRSSPEIAGDIVRQQEVGEQDEVPRLGRVPKKRSVEENRFHDAMRNLLLDHGLWVSRQKKQFSLKESISKPVVDEYEAGAHEGPTLENLQMDWLESMSSQWNSAAIYILTCHILDRIKNDFYPDLKYADWMTTKRVFEEFRAKLSTSKEEYIDVMASNAPDTDIDAAIQRARRAAKNRLKKTRNRRNMRRKTLYNCRLKIILENLGTHPAWESALQLMHAVGDLAMSDDETDNERSTRRKKVVRRVEKQWASTSFKIMLNTLDLYYSRFYFDGFQKPGPGPRDRLTTIVSESPRSTPRFLPKNCYSVLYISGLTGYQKSLLRYKRDMAVPTLPLPA